MLELHLELYACNVAIIFISFQLNLKWPQFFINISFIKYDENPFNSFQVVPFV